MPDSLCKAFGKYRTWNHSSGVSDHRAVILHINFDLSYISYPFKLNPTCRTEEDFTDLMRKEWDLLLTTTPGHLGPLKSLLYKLNILQPIVHLWEKNKKKSIKHDLSSIEGDILSMETHLLHDPSSEALQEDLKTCHSLGMKLLTHKEESLRQYSRVVWLLEGDQNSRYFHNFSNKIQVTNLVWEATDTDNSRVQDLDSIKRVARFFFVNIFREPNTFNIDEQLGIIKLFSSLFLAEDD